MKEKEEVAVVKEKIVNTETKVAVIQEKPVYIINCPETLLKENEGNYRQCLENLKKTAEQLSVDCSPYEIKSYSDSKLQKEEAMIFTQGQESTYYINAKVLYRSVVQFDLLMEDTPTDAKILLVSKNNNSVTYKIIWKPSNVIKSGSDEEKATMKVTLTDLSFKDASEYNNNIMSITFEAISKTMEKDIIVKKDEQTTVAVPTQTTTPVKQTVEDRR